MWRGRGAVHSRSHSFSWLAVAGVCKYWRDVALDLPQLWTVVPATDKQIFEDCLSRSRLRPLHVLCTTFESPSHRSLCTALAHSHRIQSLIVCAPLHWLSDLGADVSFPILQNLSLSCEKMTTGSLHGTPLPQFFINEKFPALRSLWLRGFSVPLTAGVLSAKIHHLSISRLHDNISQTSLLRTLASMADLETLNLDHVYIREDGATQITLPRLKHLRMSGSLSDSLAVLLQLVLPPTTDIDFDCITLANLTDQVVSMFSKLRRSYDCTVSEPLTEVFMCCDAFEVQGLNEAYTVHRFLFLGRRRKHALSDTWEISTQFLLPTSNLRIVVATSELLPIRNLLQGWSLDDVHDLSLSQCGSVGAAAAGRKMFMEIIPIFPNLSSLGVLGFPLWTSLPDVIWHRIQPPSSVAALGDGSKSNSMTGLVFPNLRQLIISHDYGDYTETRVAVLAFLLRLRIVLRARQREGLEVETLKVGICSPLRPDDHALLQSMVRDFSCTDWCCCVKRDQAEPSYTHAIQS